MRLNRQTFNFRDVTKRLGIPGSNENHWAVGHILSSAAIKRGIPVYRPLTQKTDPDAKVGAPHCIAAYPMTFFEDALRIVGEWWGERTSQGDLFDENIGN